MYNSFTAGFGGGGAWWRRRAVSVSETGRPGRDSPTRVRQRTGSLYQCHGKLNQVSACVRETAAWLGSMCAMGWVGVWPSGHRWGDRQNQIFFLGRKTG
jgi:hypothetical protein